MTSKEEREEIARRASDVQYNLQKIQEELKQLQKTQAEDEASNDQPE